MFKERDCMENLNIAKWIELAIPSLTLVAIVVGGIFTYIKYDNYRRESNYQKVITRYLDNNIDIFTYGLSFYTINVVINLDLAKNNMVNAEEGKDIFRSALKDSEELRSSLHKLMVFDPIVFQSYFRIINEATGSLHLITKEPFDIEDIKSKKRIIENWSRFIIFNLQDIGELLRKNTYDYDTPNIEKFKEKEAYKEIINRFKKFICLWDSMINARSSFKSYKENNKDLQRTNPNKFKGENDKLNSIWTAKTAELYNYVAKYLDERGIPTAKAKED
ncbi:MAG: hypothetical protein KJ757_01780 [Planctomycetes bacterium]|nr:hypothetical protein [Planctomycetota bacterium]MBU1519000.1 hypothetical protein [Planctomycetota bacterium]MBU2457440.1 hypothetical protein [Planctomycetota bacterium]MBU2596280.1 hypothetical protein [Planctomycetota bacterium]